MSGSIGRMIKCRISLLGPGTWVEAEVMVSHDGVMFAVDRKGTLCASLIPSIEAVAEGYVKSLSASGTGIVLEQ